MDADVEFWGSPAYDRHMSYVIYGAPGSGSGIVEAACAEIGVDYVVRDLDARKGEHRGDAYARINPQRKLPALELDGGEIITESVAIVLTLDERHREARLLPPPGSRDRAQALRWMLFLATEIYPLVEMMDFPERFADSTDVWLDEAWRREHLPRVDGITAAVIARPALAEVWARHLPRRRSG